MIIHDRFHSFFKLGAFVTFFNKLAIYTQLTLQIISSRTPTIHCIHCFSIYSPAAGITNQVIGRSYFIPCDVLVNEPDLLVQRYVNQVVDCDHQPAPIAYDNGIKVIDRFVRYVPESEVLQILTGWEAAAGDWLDPYTVSLQIITSDWRNVRQIDRRLYDNWLPWDALLLPWDVIELSTEGLPPGDYRLMFILYNRNTGEKVSGLDLTSGETGNILPLLSFTIES